MIYMYFHTWESLIHLLLICTSLLVAEVKVQVRIPIWPSQMTCLSKFLFWTTTYTTKVHSACRMSCLDAVGTYQPHAIFDEKLMLFYLMFRRK